MPLPPLPIRRLTCRGGRRRQPARTVSARPGRAAAAGGPSDVYPRGLPGLSHADVRHHRADGPEIDLSRLRHGVGRCRRRRRWPRRRPRRQRSTSIALAGDAAAKAGAPRASEQSYVAVICYRCQTRLTATLDQVGDTMLCPDCGMANVVPPPPREKTQGGERGGRRPSGWLRRSEEGRRSRPRSRR